MAVQTANDIIHLINAANVTGALNELINIFGKENHSFSKLSDEFINQPNNFNEVAFGDRLKIFIASQRAFIDGSLKAGLPLHEGEDAFEDLASLDFKNQERKIKGLMKYRNFGAFIIRAQGEYGQRWFIHQIKKSTFPHSQAIPIGRIGTAIDLNHIVQTLSQAANSSHFLENDETSYKLECIAESLPHQLTNDLLIVMHDASDFLVSPHFQDFYEYFIKHITPRMRRKENKIVLLMIDHKNHPYDKFSSRAYPCRFYGDTQDLKEQDFIKDWKVNEGAKPYLVGLDQIGEITCEMFMEWKENLFCEDILEKFEDEETVKTFLAEECNNGNPHLVMEKICDILNYQEQWH